MKNYVLYYGLILSSVLCASAALRLVVLIHLLTEAVVLMPSASVIFLSLILWCISGFLFGVSIWASNEGRYEKEYERRKQDGMVA